MSIVWQIVLYIHVKWLKTSWEYLYTVHSIHLFGILLPLLYHGQKKSLSAN